MKAAFGLIVFISACAAGFPLYSAVEESSLLTRLDRLEKTVDGETAYLDGFESRFKVLQKEKKGLDNRLRVLGEALDKRDKKLTILNQGLKEKRKQLAAEGKESETIEALKAQCDKLKGDWKEINRRYEEVAASVTTKNKEITELKETLERQKAAPADQIQPSAELTAKLKNRETEIANLRKQLEDKASQADSLSDKLSSTAAVAGSANEAAAVDKKEVEGLNQKLTELSAERDKLKVDFSAHEEEFTRLKKTLAEKEAALAQVTSSVAATTPVAASEPVAAVKTTVVLKAELKTLKHELVEARNAVNTLRAGVKKRERQIEVLQEKEAAHGDTVKELKLKLDDAVKEREGSRGDAERARKELERFEAENGKDNNRLAKVKAQYEQKEQALNKKITELKDRLDDAVKEQEGSRSDAERARKDLERFEAESSKGGDSLAKVKAQYEQKEQALEKKIAELNDRIEGLTHELKTRAPGESKLSEMRRDLDSRDGQIAALRKRLGVATAVGAYDKPPRDEATIRNLEERLREVKNLRLAIESAITRIDSLGKDSLGSDGNLSPAR